MNEAEKLLNSLSEEDISLQLVDPETEPHIVIGDDRFISVPKELQRIAVQYDHDVETVTFDCPRYWDGLDMSKLRIYINYMRKDRYVACYKATDVTVDDADSSIMHFNWTISRNVTEVKGELKFLVCIKKGDAEGFEINHWNSELNNEMYVSEGLEADPSILDPYPDIIAQWEDEVQRVKDILLEARDSGEFDGATFTPSVDADGNLSWTNDKGRDNPATVNIKGYSPTILVREIEGGRQLIITDSRQSQTIDVMDGVDGYSPVILVREVEGGKELIITDKKQSQTVKILDGVDGKDGTNGTDGYSPTILVREIDGGKQLVITDYRGSQTVDILNGTDGKDGTNGVDGKDGTNGTNGADGYSPRILVRTVDGGHQLVITDYSGSQTVDVMDGTDGQDGAAGTNGTDGVSPTITVDKITGGHRVTITDKNGAKTFDVKDGTNTTETGAAGVSPTVSVVGITGGHRVTITDVDGAKTFDVMDGATGATGPAGKDGSDGYSPKITARNVAGGHQLVITDYTGSQTVDVMNGADGAAGAAGKDGANGADGYSPTVTVADITGGHRVTITDKNGGKSFDVMDGAGGSTDGTAVYIGETEPASGPVLWFDTSPRSTG